MSEFKGTKGPWYLDDFDNVVHGESNDWGRKESVRVSGVALPGRVTEEYAANTQLVAAAPELLEALQAVVRVADRSTDEFDMARAAIAKALGK